MFYQKITNSLILCIFCSILSISFRSIRFYNIFRRNARDLGNLRNENSSLKCAADWSRLHKTSKMGESTMTEKRYLKWYNKVRLWFRRYCRQRGVCIPVLLRHDLSDQHRWPEPRYCRHSDCSFQTAGRCDGHFLGL